jgi:hypothetical protein
MNFASESYTPSQKFQQDATFVFACLHEVLTELGKVRQTTALPQELYQTLLRTVSRFRPECRKCTRLRSNF